MIADSNYDIIYMNDAAREMFRVAAEALRSEIPNFDAENLVGNNIDAFHREPARQRRILERLGDTYTTQLAVGGRTFRLIANPIIYDGNRLGTVVEWSDLTAQLKLEEDAQQRVLAEHFKKKKLMNTIIRELHHRIKNDLQGVIGLLRLSVSNVPENVPVINDAIRQINAVAMVYSLQSASVSLNLKLKDMVTTLVAAANETFRGQLHISLREDEIGDFYVSEGEAVSVALIINELLVNAVKHGSCSSQDSQISVSLDRQAETVRLHVSNQAEYISADFSIQSGNSAGTGLELVRSLLPQPGSELSFNVEDGKVTAVLAMQHPLLHREVAQPM